MPLSWPRGACRRTWLQARAASRNLSVPMKPRAPVYVRTMMVKNAQKKQRRRGPGRQFEPGQSGNPAGRPRGARNRATVLAEKLMQDDIEDVVRAVVDAAKERDMTAAKLVLERVAPRPKGRAVRPADPGREIPQILRSDFPLVSRKTWGPRRRTIGPQPSPRARGECRVAGRTIITRRSRL